jgi:hypothetical protein
MFEATIGGIIAVLFLADTYYKQRRFRMRELLRFRVEFYSNLKDQRIIPGNWLQSYKQSGCLMRSIENGYILTLSGEKPRKALIRALQKEAYLGNVLSIISCIDLGISWEEIETKLKSVLTSEAKTLIPAVKAFIFENSDLNSITQELTELRTGLADPRKSLPELRERLFITGASSIMVGLLILIRSM